MAGTAAPLLPPPASPPWSPCAKEVHNDLWFVGVLLDAVATLAGTGGKQLLRYAAVKNNPWYYPLGLVCTAMIDPAFDLAAYSFAAQSIIAPMAGMVVVWNIAIAPCTLGEVLTPSRKYGALLIIIGTFFVGWFGNHNDKKLTVDDYLALFSRPVAILYYLAFAVWSAVCAYYWRHGTPFVSGFYVGALGGSLAGNMFTTKAVVEMAKCVSLEDRANPCSPCGDWNPFATPVPYCFFAISMALACVSLWMLAVGLRTFETLYMITVFEGFMIVSGSISGNLVMDEKAGQPAESLFAYCLAILVILFGLYVLLRGERAANEAGLAGRGLTPARISRGARGEEKASLSADHGLEDERMRREAELEMSTAASSPARSSPPTATATRRYVSSSESPDPTPSSAGSSL